MNTDGGFGEHIRVPFKWILEPNPFAAAVAEKIASESSAGLASRLSMVYGTAGLTAALCVSKLLEAGRAKPEDGKILVTGASGGVGSISVELLARLGFVVVAVSGKANEPSSKQKLVELGSTEVLVSGIALL
jgi:acrylyl-CoA reductase (NADPH)